jgi:hypothetical protein
MGDQELIDNVFPRGSLIREALTVSVERNRALQEIKQLRKTMAWMAQAVHQAYHHGEELPGGDKITWRECSKSVCVAARDAQESKDER